MQSKNVEKLTALYRRRFWLITLAGSFFVDLVSAFAAKVCLSCPMFAAVPQSGG